MVGTCGNVEDLPLLETISPVKVVYVPMLKACFLSATFVDEMGICANTFKY